MTRLIQIIEDDKGQLSSTRIGYLFGLIVLSIPILVMTWRGAYEELSFVVLYFAGLAAGTTIMNKVSETGVQKAAYNPPPSQPEPQGVNINVGAQAEGKGEVLNTKKIVTEKMIVNGKKKK